MKKTLKLSGIIPDILTLICSLIIFTDLTLSGLLSKTRWFDQAELMVLVATAFAGLSISILFRNVQFDRILNRLESGDYEILRILENNEYPDFIEPFASARSIDILTISGTKNAHLGDMSTLNSLFSNLKYKRIRILLADPNSEALRQRYDNDEPETSEVGLDGLNRRLKFLHSEISKLAASDKSSIDVRVYKTYPTLNYVAVDGTFYWSVFGYKLRGSDCPRMMTMRSGLFPTFLDRQFENLFGDSLPLEDWISSNAQ